jgi:hypothetical protein
LFKKIALASVALSALAFNAPAAMADEPVFDCNFRSVQQDDATGQNFEGAVVGYVVHTGAVTIKCQITVNGSVVFETETGSGTGAATVSARITFAASDTDSVNLVAVATTEHGEHTKTHETTLTQVPPQAVIDLLDMIVIDYVDPALCEVLKSLAPGVGPVVINAQGDVYVNGEPQWDCPPYDIWPPA